MAEADSPSTAPMPALHGVSPWRMAALGAILVAAVYVAGSPSIDAPWLLGDEYIFIVRNAEVTGTGLAADSPWQRLQLIFRFPPQEDLYQPLPILTYAVEWSLSGGSPALTRRVDVLIHALSALLLWWVLRLLLRRTGSSADDALTPVLAWALTLAWALHPALVNTYAADMGRTHMMSTALALLSLGLHVRALEFGRWCALSFVGAVAALIAAMLCKPVVGWIVLVLVVEVALAGWRATLRAPRVYVVAVICGAFAALTVWTSRAAGLMQDASAGLFGDPVSRSALAVWIYFRDLVIPSWLSWWHLPDPQTGWANVRVWAGLLLAAASLIHAWRAWRHPESRTVAIGWAWCWATLLPVIGLVGAREAAATDRYLYQPLMGMLLVVGAVVLRSLRARAGSTTAASVRPVLVVAAILGAALLLWDLPHAALYRSTLRRAKLVLRQNPGDPRALEALAVAYNFAASHAVPSDDAAEVPAGQNQAAHFVDRCAATLREAAAATNLAGFFPGPLDEAPFHRRLAYAFQQIGQFADALQEAERARALQPDAYLTWVRLAHAFQGLGRGDDAVRAYDRCEELLPDDPVTRAVHFTDFGYLLLFELDDAASAKPKFEAALATGRAPELAYIGLARCEVRVGLGQRGFEIISQVLESDPKNALAALVLAEYHLRSHHWEDAGRVYTALIATYPQVYQRFDWYYEALRGYQGLCDQLGLRREAALAWDQAVRLHPDSRELRSFRVWAIACAGEEDPTTWANDLLAADADNPFACLALALRALRQGEIAAAVDWVGRARHGTPIPEAHEFERAGNALNLMLQRGEVPSEARLLLAAIYSALGRRDQGLRVLDEYTAQTPATAFGDVVERLRRELSDAFPP